MQTIGYLGQDVRHATFVTPGTPPPPPRELLLIESLNNFLRQIGGTRRAEAIAIANDPSYTREQREGYLRRLSGWRYRRYLLAKERTARPPPPPDVDPQLELDWMALINRFLGYRRVGLSRIARDATLSLEQKEAHLQRRSRSNYRAYERQKARFRRQSARLRARTIAQWARSAASAAARAARARRYRPPPRPAVRPRPPTTFQRRKKVLFFRTRSMEELKPVLATETNECKTGRRKYPPIHVRRYIVAAAVSGALDQAGIPRRMAGFPRGRIQDMNRFIETMVLPTVDQIVRSQQCWLDPRGGRNLRAWTYLVKNDLRARRWQDARTAWRPTADRLIRIARRGGRFRRPDWIYTPGRGRRPAFEIPPEAAHALR